MAKCTLHPSSRKFRVSARHPIIAVTGSSGAGTSSIGRTFAEIFRREGVVAAFVDGHGFRRFGRAEMQQRVAEAAAAGNPHFSHFGPESNLFDALETLFRSYAETGTGRHRRYREELTEPHPPEAPFTPWEALPANTDLLFYEGLHGGLSTAEVDIARHPDLLIGVVPVINLEWIQKLWRDKHLRGFSTEAVADTILRRMPDYVNYICPQFSRSHVNFQHVPMVDTSNPFVAREVPSPEESMVVIRFRDPKGIDFPYLLSMIGGAFMSRATTIVVPGGKLNLAMQLIFTPFVWRMMERRRKTLAS
jgi:phosphoribulokinase